MKRRLKQCITDDDEIIFINSDNQISIQNETEIKFENNLDVSNNFKDALLASLYAQTEFFKTKSKNKYSHPHVVNEKTHAYTVKCQPYRVLTTVLHLNIMEKEIMSSKMYLNTILWRKQM